MNTCKTLAPLSALLLATSLPGAAAALEDWQFDDAADTQLSALANSAGSATWAGNDPDVTTDGAGNLVFLQGSDTQPDNVFRNAELTVPNQTTGKFELAFTITSLDLSTGDDSGANIGFGVRDSTINSDLFLVRVQKQSGTLRLQHRVGGTTENLELFGTDTLGTLAVRVVFDLDNDTSDVFWTLNGGSEKCATNIPIDNLELDAVRLAANTNSTDWGATDQAEVDFVTLSTYTDPPVAPAIEDWQFNDAVDTSLNAVANEVGTANLGGAAANVLTDGSGDLVFTVGADNTDDVFRAAPLTVGDRGTGQYEMEWHLSSADIFGNPSGPTPGSGANVGFGMRDTGSNTDLFLVRVHLTNSELRLQTRVGNTNTDLADFNANSISDLKVRVTADLDADTFSVFWQLGNGIGSCVTDIAMAATDLEFDAVRVVSNTNTDEWGASDTASVDYLTIRDLNPAAPGDLSLTIVQGPGASEVTLIWPTATPGTAVLEGSTDLGAIDDWTEITDIPSVNGDNYELVIDITGGTENFFRLNNP